MARERVDLDAVERLFTTPRLLGKELASFKRREARENEPIIDCYDLHGIVRSMAEELRASRTLTLAVEIAVRSIEEALL